MYIVNEIKNKREGVMFTRRGPKSTMGPICQLAAILFILSKREKP